MNRKALLTVCLLFVITTFSSASFAQSEISQESFIDEKRELSIDQAINMALANNTQIKRALLAIDDADELVKIAYAEVLPDISSTASYSRNVEIPVFFFEQGGVVVPIQAGTDNAWLASFNVNQNIFKGEALVGIASSNIFKKVQEELFRSTAQQIITQTRVAFYQTLIAKENVRLQESQINRLEQNLSENEARLKAGLVEEYDVLRLRVQLSNQRPLLVDAKYALEEAYRNLNVVIGIPVMFKIQAKGNLNDFDVLAAESNTGENAELQNLDKMNPYLYQVESDTSDMSWKATRGDLSVINSQIDLKDKEIQAIKSRFLPTISAFYNLQYNAQEPGRPNFFRNPPPPGSNNTNPIRSQVLGLQVSMPIFQGFQRLSNVTRAKIQRKDLTEQRREAELNAYNQIVTARENLNKAFETADARKLALEQAQRGYDIARTRFDNGLGSQIDVTEAELQVRQAELNYSTMVFNYLSAKAQYDLATGQVPFIDIQN